MNENHRLLLSLADESAELERILDHDWLAVRDLLLELLQSWDQEAPGDDAIRAVDLLIQQLLEGPAAELVRSLLAKETTEISPRSVPGERWTTQTSDEDGYLTLPIYYGTDRRWIGGDKPEEWYSGDRGLVEYGRVEVTVPIHYCVGEEKSPRWWKLEFRSDPRRHIVLCGIERMEDTAFACSLSEAMASSDENDLLVFIHGYNVSFDNALRRAAQISRDLKFPGQTAIYSWASQAKMHLYTADEAAIEVSVPHLQTFLKLLLATANARFIHIIAHSMGNRLLTRVMERLALSGLAPTVASLDQVIFAAPDVDRDVFKQSASVFAGLAQRLTLYASSNDLALKASKLFHRFPRAGDAGGALIVQKGIDTVDASTGDTSLFGLGHSYFSEARSILNDLHGVIVNRLPPAKRFDLQAAICRAGSYWSYRR